MATNKNDKRVLELKVKIAEKRATLEANKTRFAPITTCSLELEGTRHNLNVLGASELMLLACKVQSLKTSADTLGFDAVIISGFPLDDWLVDIQSRLQVLEDKVEKAKLDAMEKQLEKLLSSDKKTELELDAIADAL